MLCLNRIDTVEEKREGKKAIRKRIFQNPMFEDNNTGIITVIAPVTGTGVSRRMQQLSYKRAKIAKSDPETL